jgi:cytochrome c oxidase subunit 2
MASDRHFAENRLRLHTLPLLDNSESSFSLMVRSLKKPFLFSTFTINFLLSGCSGSYSILDPAGPSATIAAWLWWLMFCLFTLVLIVVTVLWGYAMTRKPKQELSTSQANTIQNRWIIGGGVILPAVSIAVILFFAIPAGQKMLLIPSASQTLLQIDVKGRQWQWDISYPGTGIQLANQLHIPAGIPVAMHLSTADVIHSFWVPRLGQKLDVIPGRTNILRLQADKPGIYRGQCAEYCGLEHAHMTFTVIAHTQENFNFWLERMQRDNVSK